jgi:hypothetical protein
MFGDVITHVFFCIPSFFCEKKQKEISVLHQTHIVAVNIMNMFTVECTVTERLRHSDMLLFFLNKSESERHIRKYFV